MSTAKAVFSTIVIQAIMMGIFLVGMLLDPLAGVWIALFYFLLVGTFFIYKYFRGSKMCA